MVLLVPSHLCIFLRDDHLEKQLGQEEGWLGAWKGVYGEYHFVFDRCTAVFIKNVIL